MNRYHTKPSEETYGFDFSGDFIPQKYDPLWFYRKGLIGKKEAESVELNVFEKDESLEFSTKFLTVDIDSENFRIYTSQYLSLDMAKDMAVSLASLLNDNLKKEFAMYTQLHITYSNSVQVRKALNSLGGSNHWNQLAEEPQVHNFRVLDRQERPEVQLLRIMGVSPCGRDDMEDTIHLTVTNMFELNNEAKTIESFLTEDNTTFLESIELLNKMILLSQ